MTEVVHGVRLRGREQHQEIILVEKRTRKSPEVLPTTVASWRNRQECTHDVDAFGFLWGNHRLWLFDSESRHFSCCWNIDHIPTYIGTVLPITIRFSTFFNATIPTWPIKNFLDSSVEDCIKLNPQRQLKELILNGLQLPNLSWEVILKPAEKWQSPLPAVLDYTNILFGQVSASC